MLGVYDFEGLKLLGFQLLGFYCIVLQGCYNRVTEFVGFGGTFAEKS